MTEQLCAREYVGPSEHSVPLLEYMRSAFCLNVAEVKPIAALSRTDGRDVVDEVLLEELVMPVIEKHRDEWDT